MVLKVLKGTLPWALGSLMLIVSGLGSLYFNVV